MRKVFSITICTILLISCEKNASNENFESLKEKFNGKYEIISSISKDAVDLNMDGIASTNLISENSEIFNAGLELKILNDSKLLFEDKWPVETILNTEDGIFDSTCYHPTYIISYSLYINPISCQFEDNYSSIKLLENIQQNSTNKLISIESITIEENETIKVITIRKLYTMKGWIKTKIESRYKRYTSLT